MKKIVTILLMAVVLMVVSMVGVYAVSNDDLANTLYEMGSKYGMTASDRVKLERYLSDYPVSEADANAVVAKAESAVKVMEDAGVTSWDALTETQKSEVRSLATEAADILDVELVIKNGQADIYKDGKLIESVSKSNGTLAYTGNNSIVLVVSGIVAIALAFVVARKKLANA